MKIVVMGTGVMACLFGGRMCEAGHDVWLVSNWKEQIEKISKDGLIVSEKDKEDKLFHPHAIYKADEVVADGKYPDLVLISSKGYQTAKTTINALPAIGSATLVLTLQNGMGNGETIAEKVPEDRVFQGAASVAADMVEYGHVADNTNRNRSPLINIMPFNRQDSDKCQVIEKLFTAMGYSTMVAAAAEKNIWKKLAMNSSGNAIAAISQLANFVYANDMDGFILLSQLCAEVCAVANAKGIPLDYYETRAFIHKTYYNQHHYVSTCQDVHNERATEIDTINGVIVREGKALGIPTPVNETVYHMVRLISNHYAEQWKK